MRRPDEKNSKSLALTMGMALKLIGWMPSSAVLVTALVSAKDA